MSFPEAVLGGTNDNGLSDARQPPPHWTFEIIQDSLSRAAISCVREQYKQL